MILVSVILAMSASPAWAEAPLDEPAIAAGKPVVADHSAREIASGAPFREHSQSPSDYAAYRLSWWFIAPVVLLAIRLPRMLRHVIGDRAGAPTLIALITAVVLLFATDALLLRQVPNDHGFVPHPTLVWAMGSDVTTYSAEHNRYIEQTDSRGLRPIPPGYDERHTILILGDSSTYGISVHYDRIYSWLLSRVLTDGLAVSPPRIDNRAVPGYSSWQGRHVMEQCLRDETLSVVVVAFMPNDWTPALVSDKSLELSGFSGTCEWALRHSHLYLALRHYLNGARTQVDAAPEGAERLTGRKVGREATNELAGKSSAAVRVSPQEFEENLDAIRQMCVARKIPVVFMILPMSADLDRLSMPYREAVGRVAAREGARFLNLWAQWKRRDRHDFLPNDLFHPDARGHLRIASSLGRFLMRQGLLGPTRRLPQTEGTN